MKKKRFSAIMLAASLAVSSFAAFASTGKGSDGTFTDVEAGVFYDEASYYLKYEGIMVGDGDGTFKPTDAVTRAQVVTTLYALAGKPESSETLTFSDVTKTSAYYYKPIQWATENDIVAGYEDGTFRPKAFCTRAQLARIVSEFANKYGYTDMDSDPVANYDMSVYEDYASAPSWSRKANYFQWMAYHGIMAGTTTTTLSPRENATRGQWAAILTRLVTEIKAPETMIVTKNADEEDPDADVNASMFQDTVLNLGIKLQTTGDEYNDYGYKYKSADTSIVTVDKEGHLKGVGPAGSQTTVKVTSRLSGESKTITVQVGYGAATKLDYVKGDKEDQTVFLDSKIKWSSTADLIKDIETINEFYTRYHNMEFTFNAVDEEGEATYVAKYDSDAGKVVIMQNGEDVTETFNKAEEKEFKNMAITFGDDYNILQLMTDLADIADIAGKKFDGEFTYRDTVITNIEATDDFYVSATIDGQQYYFFNIGDNIYAQGEDHEADVTGYNAVKYWVDEKVISAELVDDPQ